MCPQIPCCGCNRAIVKEECQKITFRYFKLCTGVEVINNVNMKRLFLILMIFGLTAGALTARPKTSSLTVRSAGNDFVSVAIGDMPFSDAASEVSVRNLKKGTYYLRVMKHTKGIFRTRSEMAYEGYVTIGKGREIIAVVDARGMLVILQNEKLKKNKPYYDVGNEEARKSRLTVTVHMDRFLSVF
jgi:hypothetical protein